jgi:copper chaperone CopZ
VQDALSKVTGVSEVVSVSSDSNTAVVKVEKGKVTTAALTAAVEGAGFSAEAAQ